MPCDDFLWYDRDMLEADTGQLPAEITKPSISTGLDVAYQGGVIRGNGELINFEDVEAKDFPKPTLRAAHRFIGRVLDRITLAQD